MISRARTTQLAFVLAFPLVLATTGCLGSEPGLDIGPDPLSPLFVLPDMLEKNALQVVLVIDDTDLAVGDTFSWYAKLDNPLDDDLRVEILADYAAEVLRFDQSGSISEPILGANIARMRGGIRTRAGAPESVIDRKIKIGPQQPQLLESTGKVVEGTNGQILIQFADVEIVLPSRGIYDVYVPVRVDLDNRYALGRRFNIREQARSNVTSVTIR